MHDKVKTYDEDILLIGYEKEFLMSYNSGLLYPYSDALFAEKSL